MNNKTFYLILTFLITRMIIVCELGIQNWFDITVTLFLIDSIWLLIIGIIYLSVIAIKEIKEEINGKSK